MHSCVTGCLDCCLLTVLKSLVFFFSILLPRTLRLRYILLVLCKKGTTTKCQFYRRSKKIAPFYIWEVGYPPISVIFEEGFLIFSPIIGNRQLDDSQRITQFSSNWQPVFTKQDRYKNVTFTSLLCLWDVVWCCKWMAGIWKHFVKRDIWTLEKEIEKWKTLS